MGRSTRSVSIAALNLTSILCVPIRTQNEILGILYIDTDIADHEYTEDDMLLAAAAGNSAGLALENARIHQDLLEKQRIEQDIEAAWTIQEGFLVSDWPTDDPRFEVYGLTRPAKVVGGDFYDFARIDEDHVGLLIGDVSGKGVPAALTMAQLLAEFRLCATGADSPAEVLRRLNERMVVRSRRGTFCTAALVALNLGTGNFMGANAGHHPVLRISSDRSVHLLAGLGSADRDPRRESTGGTSERSSSPERPCCSTPTGSSRPEPAADRHEAPGRSIEYGVEGLERVGAERDPSRAADADRSDSRRCRPLLLPAGAARRLHHDRAEVQRSWMD